MVEPIEAASKYLSIGEKMVRKLQFPIKREQVYRVYPKISKKLFFSKKIKRRFMHYFDFRSCRGSISGGWAGKFRQLLANIGFSAFFRKKFTRSHVTHEVSLCFRPKIIFFFIFFYFFYLIFFLFC